ncbi:MAG: hypothetical protein ABEI07_02420 [Candidatus Nanohaloarchaea archaeon]
MEGENLFRAYDVRGETGEITPEVMERMGKAFGTRIKGEERAVVGRDVRDSSPELLEALKRGISSAGVDVTDAGLVPYGAVLYYSWKRNVPSAYVTASHLPKDYNGVKFTDSNGVGYAEHENMGLKDVFNSGGFEEGDGQVGEEDILDEYREHVLGAVDTGSMEDISVLLDPGNGASSVSAPDIFWSSGARIEVVNGDPDGGFPNRESDVTGETLEETMRKVEEGGHDVGFAYDGDADRVAVIDDRGRLLSAEETAYILAQEILERCEGPVVANVETSRVVEDAAEENGSKLLKCRVGHSYLVEKVQEEDACLGVETSRHLTVPHVLPVDDGIAVSLYLASVISRSDRSLSEMVDSVPSYPRVRVSFQAPGVKFEAVERLEEEFEEEYGDVDTMDGVRVNLEEGWVLVRASNTSPLVRLTVEAENEKVFQGLKDEFSRRVEEKIGELSGEADIS